MNVLSKLKRKKDALTIMFLSVSFLFLAKYKLGPLTFNKDTFEKMN